MAKADEKKISEYEFVVKAIKRLRKPPYKGIHSVYSGFNQAFKEYFGTNPVETTQRLGQEGKIGIRPVKGGVMLYLPEDGLRATDSKRVLETILGGDDEPDKDLESQD
jgi:hypothetical protein